MLIKIKRIFKILLFNFLAFYFLPLLLGCLIFVGKTFGPKGLYELLFSLNLKFIGILLGFMLIALAGSISLSIVPGLLITFLMLPATHLLLGEDPFKFFKDNFHFMVLLAFINSFLMLLLSFLDIDNILFLIALHLIYWILVLLLLKRLNLNRYPSYEGKGILIKIFGEFFYFLGFYLMIISVSGIIFNKIVYNKYGNDLLRDNFFLFLFSFLLVFASIFFYRLKKWARLFFYFVTVLYLGFIISSFVDLIANGTYPTSLNLLITVIKLLPGIILIVFLSKRELKEEFA